MTDRDRDKPPDTERDLFRAFPDVVELELLLPARLAAALESVARRRGLSIGQMIRQLVRDFLDEAKDRWPVRARGSPGRHEM